MINPLISNKHQINFINQQLLINQQFQSHRSSAKTSPLHGVSSQPTPYPVNVNIRASGGNSNKINSLQYEDTQYRTSYHDTGRNTYSADSAEGKHQGMDLKR